jgi:hypothetical protein
MQAHSFPFTSGQVVSVQGGGDFLLWIDGLPEGQYGLGGRSGIEASLIKKIRNGAPYLW